MLIGQTLWIVLIAYGCSFLGAFQVPVFLSSLTYAMIGIVVDFKSRTLQRMNNDDGVVAAASGDISIMQKIVNFLEVQVYTHTASSSRRTSCISMNEHDLTTDDSIVTPRTKMDLNIKSDRRLSRAAVSDENITKKSQSEIYFKGLFCACVATILYKHVWMLFVAIVPIFVYLANKIIVTFGIKQTVYAEWTEMTGGLRRWLMVRHSALFPVCMPGVFRLNSKIHKTIRSALRESIDTASSIIMIVLLLLTVTFAGIFCAVEIYSETITVVQLGNDVVNWTLSNQPELMKMFPEGVTNSFDGVIENAYQYGRTGIETYVDELLKDADTEQRKHLKTQLLSVWDRLIQYWIDRRRDPNSFTGPIVPASAISDSIGEIVNNEAAQQGLIGWVKKNLDILMDVMNSIWLIVQANLNILTSIVGTFFSLFLGGGQAVITFIINSVILCTFFFAFI